MKSNQELVKYLKSTGVLKSPQIVRAFEKIDRADFVREDFVDDTYGDYPLPIGLGQTISQPTTVAFMLELLEPKEGEKILDVGTGSGWTAALLGVIVGRSGRVLGTELVPELVEFGRANLLKCGIPNVRILQAGKTLGLPGEELFDRILVSASAEKPPRELINQLKIGGVMVVPILNSIWRITKMSKEIKKEEFPGFVFVPLIQNK